MNLSDLFTQFQVGAFNPVEIVLQMVVLVVLSSFLALVYGLRGNGLSNRWRLAVTFPLLALTTMVIILVVKSSLALSLGLVGALSIVRFRAAIKDPEELTYIFMAIALRLGFGAEQISITLLFFVIGLVVIFLQSTLVGRFLHKQLSLKEVWQLQIIFSKSQSLETITKIIQKHSLEVSLSRVDDANSQLVVFLLKPKKLDSFDEMKKQLKKIDKKVQISLLQYQPIV